MPETAVGSQTTVVTVDSPPDPGFLMQLATGYWASATLLAANELNIFQSLADTAKDAKTVAAGRGCDPRGVECLLDALCGLNLLVKQSARARAQV